jgi:hypothetical protein
LKKEEHAQLHHVFAEKQRRGFVLTGYRRYTLFLTLVEELSGMKRLLVVLVFLASSLAQQPPKAAPAPAPKTTYIRAGRVFDGTADSVRENMVIVVSAFKALGRRVRLPFLPAPR